MTDESKETHDNTSANDQVGKKKPNRLDGAQWADAKIKWRSGQWKLTDLAGLYGITPNALWKRFDRNGVKYGSDAETYEAEMATRQLEEVAKEAAERDAARRSKKNDIEDFTLKAIDSVNKAVIKRVSDLMKSGGGLSGAFDDIKAGKEIALMLKNNVETVKRIIGEEELDEEEMPVLRILGLDKGDVEQIQEEHRKENEMFGVTDDDAENALDGLEGAQS